MKSFLAILLLSLNTMFLFGQTVVVSTESQEEIYQEAYVRSRLVENVNLSDLIFLKSFTLELFPELSISARRTEMKNQRQGGTLIHAELLGAETGYIELFFRNDLVNGTVYSQAGTFKIDGNANGPFRVTELNLDNVLDQDDRIEEEDEHGRGTLSVKKRRAATANDPSIIDVMVVYPQSIETSMGGALGMENEIYYRIAEINQVFENSEIYVEYRLAHHQVVTSVPAAAQSAGDVVTPEVENLRDLYKADIVSFWSDNGSAGSGYNLNGTSGSPSNGFNTSRFSLVQTNYTFVHECGHNMGAKHDRQTYYDDSPTNSKLNITPYYRYGKSFVGYRSVMSYNSCGALAGGSSSNCGRVPYFTNPDIMVNGAPFGVPGEQQTYDPNGPANNARRLNETAPYVEAWFESLNTVYVDLVVTGGTGSGTYAEGANIVIEAGDPATGLMFDQWVGDTTGIADVFSPYTSMLMGTQNANIEATYKPLDYSEVVTVKFPITAGIDDVEESGDGNYSMYLTSSDLEMTLDGTKGNQTIGLKFNGITVPEHMEILSAKITFTSEKSTSDVTNLTIVAESNVSPLPFTDLNLISRNRTNSSVNWQPEEWINGREYVTPDLSSIIQEVVDDENWQFGNDLVLLISGTGVRSAYSFEGNASAVAEITLTFTEKPNEAPTLLSVDDQTIFVNSSLTIDTSMFAATDPEGDSLSIVVLSGNDYSVLGNVVTPNVDFVGTLYLPISVSDGELTSNTLEMMVSVGQITGLVAEESLLLTEKGDLFVSGMAEGQLYKIVNLSGQEIFRGLAFKERIEIGAIEFDSGMYFLITEDPEVRVWKLFKK